MQFHKVQFIELALQAKALSFGKYQLKSGRISPYFFNSGRLNTGGQLATLGRLYAHALQESTIDYDMIFGPAYKGIPLVSALSIALATEFQMDIPYCFNRKLAKDHGEGGNLIGHSLKGNVLIVDDVITAGTAIRESITLIEQNQARIAGIIVMFDRQERGSGKLSTVQELSQKLNVPIISIVNFNELFSYFQQSSDNAKIMAAMSQYREQYGAID